MIDYLKWLFNFRCKHERRRGIYGDEIIMTNWHRAGCLDCPKLFKSLPTKEQTVPIENWFK